MACHNPDRYEVDSIIHYHAYTGARSEFKRGDLVQTASDNVYRITKLERDEKIGPRVTLSKVTQGTHRCPRPIGATVVLRNPTKLRLYGTATQVFTNDHGTIQVGTKVLYPYPGSLEPNCLFTVIGVNGRTVYLENFNQGLKGGGALFPEKLQPVLVRGDKAYKAGDVVSLGSFLRHRITRVDGEKLQFDGSSRGITPGPDMLHYADWEAKVQQRQNNQRVEKTLTFTISGTRANVNALADTIRAAARQTQTCTVGTFDGAEKVL